MSREAFVWAVVYVVLFTLGYIFHEQIFDFFGAG